MTQIGLNFSRKQYHRLVFTVDNNNMSNGANSYEALEGVPSGELTAEIAQALIAEQGTDVVIPNGYTSIGQDAFFGSGITVLSFQTASRSLAKAHSKKII